MCEGQQCCTEKNSDHAVSKGCKRCCKLHIRIYSSENNYHPCRQEKVPAESFVHGKCAVLKTLHSSQIASFHAKKLLLLGSSKVDFIFASFFNQLAE